MPFAKNKVSIPVNYCEQGERSANCGPSSVKMVVDFLNLKKTNGQEFTLHSINRYLRTTHKWGCSEEDIESFFHRFGVAFKRVGLSKITSELAKGNILLVSHEDELHDGHYSVINGYDATYPETLFYLFQDPWPEFGPNFPRPHDIFYEQSKAMGFWILSFSK